MSWPPAADVQPVSSEAWPRERDTGVAHGLGMRLRGGDVRRGRVVRPSRGVRADGADRGRQGAELLYQEQLREVIKLPWVEVADLGGCAGNDGWAGTALGFWASDDVEGGGPAGGLRLAGGVGS